MSDEKDVMDEVLEETDEIDETEDLKDEEDEADDKGKTSKAEGKSEESIESLAAKVEALAKEKDGILKELLSTRQAKHELKGKIDAITEMMAAAKSNREEMISTGAEEAVTGVKTKDGIPVSFDDDGNPYIAKKDMPKFDNEEMAELKKELAAIKNQSFHQQAIDQNQRILADAIAGDDRYAGAYTRVQQAYQYLDAKTGDIMRQYGLNLQTTSLDEVMALLEKEYGDEFSDNYPGLDIDVVVEACTTGPDGLLRPRKVTKALKAAAVDGDSGTNQKIKNLKFMAGKPSNLTGTRNQKGVTGRTLNDIANMDVKDFESMSDADFKRLERALARMSG